jgi:hypothetical protein
MFVGLPRSASPTTGRQASEGLRDTTVVTRTLVGGLQNRFDLRRVGAGDHVGRGLAGLRQGGEV